LKEVYFYGKGQSHVTPVGATVDGSAEGGYFSIARCSVVVDWPLFGQLFETKLDQISEPEQEQLGYANFPLSLLAAKDVLITCQHVGSLPRVYVQWRSQKHAI